MSAEEPADVAEEETPALYPFYHVGGDTLNGATVQAGYLTDGGEVDHLVIDMQGLGINRVPQAFEVVYGWYTDQLNAIAGQQQAAAEQETEDGAEAEGAQ